ncbi:hypothetical protein CAPTEDRAFT_224266 [Capitella teleta]|uniref:VWFA domain-containing protein n=1 Tax=Capitella teleta TaxID=283909 RepID=R7V615_CAPTE|nr:hypothetical protein CAPTEDRAFT_224266 [Capitella teleta]|eukprot:ELU11175.1 hypothetical protein CAPTEDRAFT_224266 [Capitella teleta]
MEFVAFAIICLLVIFVVKKCCSKSGRKKEIYPDLSNISSSYENSLLQMYNVRHINAIVDQFHSLEEVSKAVRRAGLESSNLIFGIDYTHSNLLQGDRTFAGQCLHFLHPAIANPYQQVIRILGKTLESFDEDGAIPAFGFGDASTKDRAVFPFRAEGFCSGFEDVLAAYNQITPTIRLSGPTSFAPLIYEAIDIVKMTKEYHILIIIADGQVTSEGPTRSAIVEASFWPLSIIMIGVGDGPWTMMHEFDDRLPKRKFDNFQFVDYNRVLTFGANPEATFALHALMEIPDQFKEIRRLGLLDL